MGALEKVLRFGEGRRRKRLAEQAVYIGTLEPDFERLSDAELAAKTVEFKQRIENGASARGRPLRVVRSRARGVQAQHGASASSTSS